MVMIHSNYMAPYFCFKRNVKVPASNKVSISTIAKNMGVMKRRGWDYIQKTWRNKITNFFPYKDNTTTYCAEWCGTGRWSSKGTRQHKYIYHYKTKTNYTTQLTSCHIPKLLELYLWDGTRMQLAGTSPSMGVALSWARVLIRYQSRFFSYSWSRISTVWPRLTISSRLEEASKSSTTTPHSVLILVESYKHRKG